MTTHTPEQICRAAFPQARVFPASELAADWQGVAIEFGEFTYVVYQPDDGDGDWVIDTITGSAVSADCFPTLAECLGAVMTARIEFTFGFI